jgi:hypothetical protein
MCQITIKQWQKILNDHLGLRSNSQANVIDSAPASYAMDMNVTVSYEAFQIIPDGWKEKLNNTLERILSFPNSTQRHLMIVKPSDGSVEDYKDCFYKCSGKPTEYIATIPIAGNNVNDLARWVVEHIPEE